MGHLRRASCFVVAAFLTGVAVVGCGGADEPAKRPATTSPPTTVAPPTPTATPKKSGPTATDVPGLDATDAALIAGYLGWTELTKPPIAQLQTLGNAHGGKKRVWASPQREALVEGAAQQFPYPDGTVIVKQGTSGDAVTLIALMEKTGAGGAETGGWRYVEYIRAGADDAFTKVGLSQSGCAACHMNANTRQPTDWVFWSLE